MSGSVEPISDDEEVQDMSDAVRCGNCGEPKVQCQGWCQGGWHEQQGNLKRTHAAVGKDLLKALECEEEYEEEEDMDVLGQPDLGDYFGQWDMPPSSEIALCRTYANYLAQKTKIVKK